MVKLQSWTIALYLSAHECPVSWSDPVTAAWLGEVVEIVCPPLLVFGPATRFAALPMLTLSLVIEFSYQALDQHLFWAILFGWFVVKGAGPILLDALIGRASPPPPSFWRGRSPSTEEAIFERMTEAGAAPFKNLQSDPWAKERELLNAA